ncbi:hypothetical protein L9F63_005641, partial [Diploptera punctata]
NFHYMTCIRYTVLNVFTFVPKPYCFHSLFLNCVWRMRYLFNITTHIAPPVIPVIANLNFAENIISTRDFTRFLHVNLFIIASVLVPYDIPYCVIPRHLCRGTTWLHYGVPQEHHYVNRGKGERKTDNRF